MFLHLLLVLGWISSSHGHGNMVMPVTWFDAGGRVGMKRLMQCTAGANLPGLHVIKVTHFDDPRVVLDSCLWFTNYTFIPGNPTLDPALKTYQDFGTYFMKHPWRAPGSAHIFSPCGVGGGNPNGCPETSPPGKGMDCLGGGYSYGPKAEDFTFVDVVTSDWRAGSVQEVAWGMVANHGGGYSYRLCKVPPEGVAGLTEDCFQRGALDFWGDKQWVQYGTDKANRTEFRANRTRTGTTPAGSQWTKNPIPACAGPGGGYDNKKPGCTRGTQFPPPAPGLEGFGETINGGKFTVTFRFNVVDKVVVPSDLEPGQYVLSFRWDCEQTPQVWNSCASINIINTP